MALNKDVAGQKITVFAWDTVNNVPMPDIAGSITAFISKDGAAGVATDDTNPDAASDMDGLYFFDMTQDETNADLITLSAVSSVDNVLLDPVIIYTEGKLGTPISLDFGTDTIAGMLTKIVDDNNGDDFDAEHDSLNKIQTAIAVGFPTPIVASAENFTTPVAATSGSFEDTALDNETYLQVAGNGGPAVDGFGMNFDLTFPVGTDRQAATVFVNARESFAGLNSFVLVWAWNYVSSVWDQISDSSTAISGNSDADYTYILLPRHQEVSTGNVNIRFTATATNANQYLFLDQVFVTGVSSGTAFTPAEIAQAVWEQQLKDISQANQDAAGHILEDTSLYRGEIGESDSTISFKLDSNAPAIVDVLFGAVLCVEDADDDHHEDRRIISYTADRVVTVDFPFGFTPAVGDHYHLQGGAYANVNVNAVDGTAQRATDLAEIAQYLLANSVIITDVVADNSIIAQMLATSGDMSEYNTTTDAQQSIRDAIASLASLGSGSISVNHDSGGTDNLIYKTSGGAGVDNTMIRAYLTADYDADNRGDEFVKGQTVTVTTGRWSETMRLDAGAYTLEFSKQGLFGPDTKEYTVS